MHNSCSAVNVLFKEATYLVRQECLNKISTNQSITKVIKRIFKVHKTASDTKIHTLVLPTSETYDSEH